MSIGRTAILLASATLVAGQAQTFTTSLSSRLLRGATVTLPVRISHPASAQKITSVAIYFTTGEAGSKPNFSILIDHSDQVLKVADGNGQIASPYMIIEEGRRALTPPYASSGVTISEYTLSRAGGSYSLDLKVTRPSAGDADLNVSLLASDGGSPSSPGAKIAAAVWKLRVPACEPTARQMANRASRESIPLPAAPRLPDAGEKYCDPTFGTEILRLSDIAHDPVLDYTNTANVVGPLGQIGFNKTSTRFALFLNSGQVRIHSLDPDELTSSAGKNLNPLMSGGKSLAITSSNLFWSGSGAPDAADTLLFAHGMSIYKVNVAQPVNGQYRASAVADLNSLLDGGGDANPRNFGSPSLIRCSASRDTYTIACAILIATPAGAYPRIGYAVVQLASHATDRPATNWQVKAKYINGIDSDNLAGYQVVELPGSDGKAYSYTLTSPYEQGMDERGGYKIVVDKSGRFALLVTWDAEGESGRYNTSAVLDMEKLASGDPPFAFMQASGHGDAGFGVFVGMNTGYGACSSCMKRWDLASLTGDPVVTENNGIALTSPLGYDFARQYNSAFGSKVQTAVVLACPAGGCASSPPAFAGELLNLETTGVDQITRLARLNHVLFSDDYVELQPIQSYDGKLVAFTTNYGDTSGRKYVLIARVPQPQQPQ